MGGKLRRILSLFLAFGMLIQQTGFAQVATVELDLPGKLASMHSALTFEKFRPLHLRSISYDGLDNDLRLILDKGTLKNPQADELDTTTKDLLTYFFTGIALPHDTFWVNLRPDAPDNIIDPLLAQTDVGRILLESDLQLKKDTASFTSPQTPEGKEY